jgi:hypothetical protein
MTAKLAYPCPTPTKKRYATRQAAEDAAHRSQIAINAPLYPYICICTWWHLSKKPSTTVPEDATPDPQDVNRLQLQSDTTFRETVAADARSTLPMDDRIALRAPGNQLRWNQTLKELRADINRQLNERAGDKTLAAHDWRKRAEGYRDCLTLRLQECRDLRARELERRKEQREADKARNLAAQQDNPKPATTRAERKAARDADTDRQLDHYGIPHHTDKDLRRRAGEAAIKRLIDAHGDEFAHYLAEECAALGATLPDRVAKHLTQPDNLAQTA